MDQTVSRVGRARWQQVSRLVLCSLPLVTVLVIGVAVFVVGAPSSYRAARIWSGPTDVAHLSGRVQAVERYYEVERPLVGVPLQVAVANRPTVFQGRTDAEGFLEFNLELDEPPAQGWPLEVTSGTEVLASGKLQLSRTRWQSTARRRGQWVADQGQSALSIRVRPARGVFAVPFADPVLIEVRDERGVVAGAHLKLALEGVSEPAGEVEQVTDTQGLARIVLVPREHVVALKVTASAGNRTTSWYSTLPVVPGALHALRSGAGLRIRSAVQRESAFFSVIGADRRWFGGHVALDPDGRGGAVALVDLPRDLPGDSWAVVSSEPDMNSPATVGWPLGPEEPRSTFDAKDVLLLDGLPTAFERSRERPRQARWLAGVFALLAIGLAGMLLVGQVRAADAALVGHFREHAPDADSRRLRAKRSLWMLVTAV